MNLQRLTPMLFAEEVESCAEFWTARLGFAKTAEVPEGKRLGFVMLNRGSCELMYMTWSLLEKDIPAAARPARGPSYLYVEVDDIEATFDAVRGAPVFQPMRVTFYGAKEFGVLDPAGHFVVFAQMELATEK